MTQMVPKTYYLLQFELQNFNFGNIIINLCYCYNLNLIRTMSEKVFEKNLTNKINLEGKKKKSI